LDNNELNKWLELRRIQSILYEFERLHITDIEYAYLKLILVFNPSNNTGKEILFFFNLKKIFFCIKLECISSYDQIDAYRILTYKELRDHINEQIISPNYEDYSGDSERLGRLLLKLPLLSELDTSIVEEIFFVGLIGRILFFFLI